MNPDDTTPRSVLILDTLDDMSLESLALDACRHAVRAARPRLGSLRVHGVLVAFNFEVQDEERQQSI